MEVVLPGVVPVLLVVYLVLKVVRWNQPRIDRRVARQAVKNAEYYASRRR